MFKSVSQLRPIGEKLNQFGFAYKQYNAAKDFLIADSEAGYQISCSNLLETEKSLLSISAR